jgi:hypothetical protein
MRVIGQTALAGILFCATGVVGAGVPDHKNVSKILARIPLSFEQNTGQVADKSAAWVGRGNGYGLALSATGATITLSAPGRSDVVRMQFLNARPDAPSEPLDPLPGKTNYLIGRDPKRWLQNLATYGRIKYRNVYDRVDVAWYGNQGQLEYDFLVQPGADPSCIRVRFEGTRNLVLESAGDVRIETAGGSMKLRLPEVYQEIAGARRRVQGRYVLRSANEVGFELAGYDRSRPLVIDPTLLYGTYFGGSGLGATSISTDSLGNVYIGGSASAGLPLVKALQPQMLGSSNAWVAKFDPSGTNLLYSTWVGGSAQDVFRGLTVTASNEIIATGMTYSTDFPLANAAQSQGPSNGVNLPFAFKLNASGSAFVYSTYLGGACADSIQGGVGWAVASDAAGNAYIAGQASSPSFATTPGVYQSSYGGGFSDAFVVKLGPSGALVYSTLLGGAGSDYAVAIAADSSGNAYIAGRTGSSSFPNNPPGAVTTNAGNLDTFVAELNPTATAVTWLTFLGGTGNDVPIAMVRDSVSGELYVAGYSTSTDLPTTMGVIQPGSNGPRQGFIASINPDGMSFGFVTYLGGGREDVISGIALTPGGQLAVAGSSTSTDFPTENAIQPAFVGLTTSLYASANSGASWTASDAGLPAWVSALSPDPSNPGTMLAASGDTSGPGDSTYAWFRTTNNGASWTHSGESPFPQYFHAVGGQFVRSPSDPAVVYFFFPASMGQSTTPGALSVWMAFGSNDGGATWRQLAYPIAPSATYSDWLWGMAVSPADGDTILEIGLSGAVFRSTDGGATFTQVSTIPSALIWSFAQEVAVSPDGSVYVATGSGLYKSTDFGTTWIPPNLMCYCGPVAVSASNASVVYVGGAYSNALFQSTDAGATWSSVTPLSFNLLGGGLVVVAPSNPQFVYVASGNQVVVSADGGTTWSNPVSLPGSINAVAVSTSDPTAVWAATGPRTTDSFAAKLASDGQTLLWSTFYSGSNGASVNSGASGGNGVAAVASGDVWIAGGTSSTDLPITPNAYSSGGAYGGAAFLARISDSTAPCSYSLNPSSVVAYGAESVGFAVTAPSGCAWTATPSESSWITVQSGNSGTGSGVVSAALTADATGSTLTGNISVEGQTFSITQAASSCTYSLSSSGSLPASGGTVQITVTTADGCPWSVVPLSPLITIVSGGSGTGNGTVTLSLPANRSVQWFSPVVQVGPQSITLSEANICAYSLSPLTLGPAAASGSMAVTANHAGCSWAPQSDAAWLSVSGSGTGSGTFSYSVQANTSDSRTADITLDHRQFAVKQGAGIATLSPSTLGLGSVAVGDTSAAKTVTLTNHENVTLNFSSIVTSAGFTVSSNTCGTSITAGATCTVGVTFSPTATGAATGTLTFTDDAQNSPQAASLTGTGITPVTLSRSTLALGSVAVGNTSAAKTVTLTNHENITLNFSSILTSAGFTVSSNTCGTSITAGATCTVGVTFSPAATGDATGTLTFTDDAQNSPQAASLTGTGITPVTLSPSTLALGSVAVGNTSAAKTVTLTNHENVTLNFSSIVTSSGFAVASNTCGTSIAAGTTCTVGVTFSPTATGAATGTLTFTDDAQNSPQTVSLTGTGK